MFLQKNKTFEEQQEDKNFYRKVIALVVPMALQNLINVGVTTADVVMLGKVGETVLSGASLAGQIQFILNLIFFGITSGAAVLTAQYWGKRDIRTIEKILGIALRMSLIAGIVFTSVTLAIPIQLMKVFTSEPEVIAQGAKYLRIVAFSYLFMSVSMIYLNIMRSVERVVISTVVYLLSLIVNIILNALLIFGLFGLPALGIEGAAIATLSARALELLIMLFYAYKINKEIRLRISDIFLREPVLFRDFLKYSGPVMANELMWGAGYSANAAIIGHLGSSAVAANSVAQVARQLSMVVVFGVAGAAAIMIGKAIGEGKEAMAEEYARKLVRLTLVGGFGGMAVILLVRPFLVANFAMTGLTAEYMGFMLMVMAVYVIGQAVNSVLVVGVFRAGGDTKFGLILDVASMWGGSILCGALAAFVFKFSIPVVYLILMCDELLKLPFCIKRYKTRVWLKNVTR